jgi:hypothetical protein
MVGDSGQAAGAFGAVPRAVLAIEKDGFTEVFGLFFDNPETVAALSEDIGGDFLADAVASTEVLIDPNP